MRKELVYCITLSSLFSGSLNAVSTRDSNLGGDIESGIEPLFVSLGSYCRTAHMQRDCGIRKAAFPFDWVRSFDGEKLIKILEEDFLHFLNPGSLRALGQTLLNDYYYLEFLNEGDWEDADYKMDAFSIKCQRRIHRFRQLDNYQGRVFFVRMAHPFPFSPIDPNWVWNLVGKVHENIEITQEYAEKLYHTLKNYFPNLDFGLIIMNRHDEECFVVERQLSGHILMIRISDSFDSYKEFYSHLLLSYESLVQN